MKRIYDKTVKELISQFINEFILPDNTFGSELRDNIQNGGYFYKEELVNWFKSNYPLIKIGTINAHLLLLSVNAPSRVHYNVHSNGSEDILFQINSQTFRKYIPTDDPSPIYKNMYKNEETDNENINMDTATIQEFAYEKDLQSFLVKNLNLIEDGLVLYKDEEITGVEFPVGGRFIDILAIDKNNNYVVIELKVSKGYERVIGQLLRYMGWIEKNQIDKGQKVRGVIIAKEISEDLILACSKISDVKLFEYELSV